MTPAQWDVLCRCARGEPMDPPPVALIIDSPWLPGHLGLSTLDYLFDPQVWLEANLRVCAEFPDVIFVPGFWAEIGMTAEPSAFGCRVSLHPDRTPDAHPMLRNIEEVDRLEQPNPRCDGLMPVLLRLYERMEPAVRDAGHVIKIVAARGPLTTAAHLLGVTEFLLALKLQPEPTHRLLRMTTRLVGDWLEAQSDVLSGVEGILVLDDLAGMMSEKDYLEFAHPYLKQVFDRFPGVLKLFHNDTDNPVAFRHLPGLGIDVFNFTHLQPLDRVRELVGPDLCLMGNVPPLDVLARGTPDQVRAAVAECLRRHPGARGLLLSAGGGTSPGTPGENIRAMVEAARAGRPPATASPTESHTEEPSRS